MVASIDSGTSALTEMGSASVSPGSSSAWSTLRSMAGMGLDAAAEPVPICGSTASGRGSGTEARAASGVVLVMMPP